MNKPGKTIIIAGQIALKSLRKNTGRTILTILGIVIGIMAVIAVLSAGEAIKGLILSEIESFGSNYVQVETKTPQTSQTSTENATSMVGGSVVTTLKVSDAEKILNRVPNLTMFYSGLMGQEIINYKNEIKKSFLFGTNEDFIKIDKSKVRDGRFFTEEENQALAKVAVIGYKVKQTLFGDSDPLEKTIKIGKENFRIIGVMEERGPSFMFDMDNMVFLPVNTLQKKLLGVDYVSFILFQMIDPEQGDQTATEITETMREIHNISDPNKDDFAVTTMEQAVSMVDTIIVGIQILLIVLGSISLIVGGVGIMNIMYVSVLERTYEIGLRKSVGAKSHDILWQFLIEALILTLVGGIIGIILGVGLTWLVSIIAQSQGFAWQFSISISGLLLALSMSGIVGVAFGLYPAQKAAKLNPIEALRKE